MLLPPGKRKVETADGSATLYSEAFDECYHSTRDGALKESLQKHVLPAFSLLPPRDEITILDVCFGLGYNTWTTLYYLQNRPTPKSVTILSPEFDRELVAALEHFDYPSEFDFLRPIIEAVSRDGFYEDERFAIQVLFGDARQSIPKIDRPVDIVYQDPFSPKKNPLLWTREYFSDLRRIVSDEVILTTYSSATPVRMGLYENGFRLYEPLSEGVRNGTVASLRPLDLKPIDMELKTRHNPAAASLRDADFLRETQE